MTLRDVDRQFHSFEALTADRHYRPGMDRKAALAILDAGIGTRFDARVVAALKQSLVSI